MIRPDTDDDRRLTRTHRLTPGQPRPNTSIGYEVVANTLLVVGLFAAFLVAGAVAGTTTSIPGMILALIVALATAIIVPLALVRTGRELGVRIKWLAERTADRDRPPRRGDADADDNDHTNVARTHRGIEPNRP